MYFLYNIAVTIVQFLLKIIAIFNSKISLFVNGRKETLLKLKQAISKNDNVFWFHCASLGEFEQGRPIIERIKIENPKLKIVVTFFSPSGYEVRKNYKIADVVCYLPLDTKKNVQLFLDAIHPEFAFFVKYEFWPNYLKELKKRNIKTLLISGIFRKNQMFFKFYGSWMRKSLKAFTQFFVQEENSKRLLNSINFNNVKVSGDTRFDRVFEITNQNNELKFINEFKNDSKVLVAGSTWKDDEIMLVNYINKEALNNEKFIIAPHNIHSQDIQKLKNEIKKPVVLYSEMKGENLQNFQVFIVDTIGILTKIYSYATVAYVGGGFTKTGVHNVLEPATFGVPIIIGPNFNKFKEAVELVESKSCFVANNSEKLSLHLKKIFLQNEIRELAGNTAKKYVEERTGATAKILKYLKDEGKVK
ncbi:MAG: glycosyltransferase N-terminal domain-containing protein [Lutibacter sp.]|uniref:3-deoxy-D-manno-octulosonic acid transferase n=1 Tax=Lutibacter sp. TaxID=1925666 RepID=UPI00299E3B77|nr:glycosyltransferase N-terminal domain-containing protein [Lutibacter sp.]MDX1828511.1 glycosyltransferase N-terminal domain-containing protein [Lutibacter sp.]